MTVLEQAIAWHLRLADADEADWLSFTEWLEAAPANAAAYDQVAMTDDLIGESEVLASVPISSEEGANDNLPVSSHRLRWSMGGLGVAAAAAALALIPGLIRHAEPSVYETAPGVARTVSLVDGSRVELSGGTRLIVDASAQRVATLERGEALFHVRHDPRRSFTVRTGDVAIEDLGTVFSVARDQDAMRVAVAEGSVAVSRGQGQLTLNAGEMAVASASQGGLLAAQVSPAEVGGWRNRSLTFQGESLAAVVERLNRLYALHISLAPNLSERPFTGMVQLTGDAARDVPHLAALMGTKWRRDGDGWLLSSAD